MVTASWMRCARIPVSFILLLPTRIRWPPQSYGVGSGWLSQPCTLKEYWPRSQPFETDRPPAVLGGWRPKVPEACKAWQPRSIFPASAKWMMFRFIEANYHLPIGLCDVAIVGFYSRHLTNLVRQQTGQSVHRWIVKRRMAEARSLLLEQAASESDCCGGGLCM